MPKLKERPESKQDKLFQALLSKNMKICGYDRIEDVAERLQIHKVTLGYKVRDPDKFTRRELRRLFSILKFSQEEKSQVM